MRFAVIVAFAFLASALQAEAGEKSSKSKVTTCSSYTNINGTTHTTCRTK